MPLVKNCLHCSNVKFGWYQDNSCTADSVRHFSPPDPFGNLCSSYPSCRDVHPNQTEDCIHFERSLTSRLAEMRSNMCMFFYNLKLKIKGKK